MSREITRSKTLIIDGGGGGSSDVSVATVTINNTSSSDVSYDLEGTIEQSHSATGVLLVATEGMGDVRNGNSSELTAVLYQGKASLHLTSYDSQSVTTSGNIEYSESQEVYIVTGDCTITVA